MHSCCDVNDALRYIDDYYACKSHESSWLGEAFANAALAMRGASVHEIGIALDLADVSFYEDYSFIEALRAMAIAEVRWADKFSMQAVPVELSCDIDSFAVKLKAICRKQMQNA